MKLLGLWLVLRLANALWPIPSKLTTGTSVLWIDKRVKVTYHGLSHEGTVQLQSVELPSLLLTDETFIHRPVLPIQGSSTTITSQQIVQHAVDRLYESIFAKSFIPWKFHPRNSDFEPSTKDKSFITSIVLKQTDVDIAKISNPDIGEVDESYILTLSDDGVAVITAKSSIGLSRGLTTFSQLFFKHSDGGSYTALAPVEIEDAPKFPYRGINMDVSRNYYPVSDIKRMVDAMAFNKLNQLHLHVTDGQSWPIEIPSLPELAAKGAYNRALTYSPRDLEEIQTYGALLGVAVTLEIDMPGHTSAIWHSHPELIAAFNVQPDWDTYCAEPPCGTLKLNSSEVYDFLDKLWADLLPRVSPYTSYFHTGGDEVKPAAYTKDETVGTDDLKVLQPLLQKLIDFNHDKVRQAGLTPVVWEEMLLQWNLTLGKDVIIQTWRSDAAVAEAVQKGYKTLAGNFHYWVCKICPNFPISLFPHPTHMEKSF